jgi:dynein heavy chain, axonemal
VRITRSNKLTEGLKGENERWKECLVKLEEESQFLLSEVFLAAASISYLGPFSGANRRKIIDQVKKELRDFGIPVSSEQRGIEEVISDPLEVQNWRICGLPSD